MRLMLKTGILVASALLSFACSGNPQSSSNDGKGNPEEETGELSLKLVGVDSAGVSYRLRDAVFEITPSYYPYPGYGGYPGAGGAPAAGGASSAGGAAAPGGAGGATGDGSDTVYVSSETEPDAPTIRTRLLPGTYYVTLQQPGWSLERLTPSGPEPIAQSVLLSEATQYAYVYDRGTAEVNYRFGVDGTLIDFRYGDLDIDFTVERPGDSPGGYGGAGGITGAGGAASTGGASTGGGADYWTVITPGGSTTGGYPGL